MPVEIGGRRRGVSQLEKVARNLEQKLPGAMKAVAEALREHAVRCFETQSDPYGVPWTPLSGKTVYKRLARGTGLKRVRGGGHGPRQRGVNQRRSRVFGRLRAIGFDDVNNALVTTRLTKRAERMLSNGGVKILLDTSATRNGLNARSGDDTAVVGFGGPHAHLAQIHHDGSEDGTLPSRKLLPLDDDGRPDLPPDLYDEITSTIREAIHDGVGAGAGGVQVTARGRATGGGRR